MTQGTLHSILAFKWVLLTAAEAVSQPAHACAFETAFRRSIRTIVPRPHFDTLVLAAGESGIAGILLYLRMREKGLRTSRIRLVRTTEPICMITEVARQDLAKESRIADFWDELLRYWPERDAQGRKPITLDLRLRLASQIWAA